jgi:hypothetical protein
MTENEIKELQERAKICLGVYEEMKIDQGDRSLISYFERGREFGVRATSEVSHGDRGT